MSLQQKDVSVIKKRILVSFRKQKHMVSEDDSMDWNDLCLVMRTLDPQYCTDERMAELKSLASLNIIADPGGSAWTRIKLEPFIDWIFVNEEVKKASVEAGNLLYPLSAFSLAQGASFVEEVRNGVVVDPVQKVQEVLRRYWKRSQSPQWPDRSQSPSLLLTYTDLEPDDIMAIAQLWEWKTENKAMNGMPLMVFHANLASKDWGTVLEKKQLLVQLMLGMSKYYTLTREGDDGSDVSKHDNTHHPQQQGLIEMRSGYLDEICEELESFPGQLIDFYIMSPGAGNLGAILRRLKDRKSWPLPGKRWKVSMYSGSFNMRGMTPEDIDAVHEIMATCAEGPLIDVGKFPFFGGKDYHPWTDALTTFAMPSFASDLTARFPILAAMLKLFNDEFNSSLIDPKKIIVKGAVWTPEEEERFLAVQRLYDIHNADRLQEYAYRLLADEGIRSKIAAFKMSTIKAFAHGGCDSPLCDQLLFLHEWLERRRPEFLVYEDGFWHYNAEKGFVDILPAHNGDPRAFRARRPKVAHPRQEDHLLEMRHALQDYLLRHLYTLDCHISKAAGRMVFHIAEEWDQEVRSLVKQVRAQRDGDNPVNVIKSATSSDWWQLLDDHRQSTSQLMLVYTDMEPDDIMAIAQLWEWKNEVDKLEGGPLVIFATDFISKEGGEILEKKQIMSALTLGLPYVYVLTPESDTTGQQVSKNSKTVHPRNSFLQRNRQAEIDRICEDLIQFSGSVIDFYIIAPGLGNLGAIIDGLKAKGRWPLPSRPNWRVSFYSGAYNMGGMTQRDIEALSEVMQHSNVPLVDVGKFPFFGGKNCHPWTDALTTFASPSFAVEISTKYPLLAAAMTSFNDEFNAGLVNPHTKDFFSKKPLTPEESSRYESYKAGFVYTQGDTVRKFCRSVVEDADVFKKLPEFKKSTFRAFAYGGCDSPLCDQLIFLAEYLMKENPDALTIEDGLWFYNSEKGFTEVRKDQGLFRAIRPTLKDPRDEVVLTDLRRTLESYLLQHLDAIKCKADSARG